MSRPTQEELRAREHALLEGKTTEEALVLRAADRLARWALIVAAMVIPPEIQNFAAAMTMKFGPKVRVHQLELDWVTALLVARYGEAEYFWGAKVPDGDHADHAWPPVFTADDVFRANEWFNGDWPRGTAPIPPKPSEPITPRQPSAEDLKAEIAELAERSAELQSRLATAANEG